MYYKKMYLEHLELGLPRMYQKLKLQGTLEEKAKEFQEEAREMYSKLEESLAKKQGFRSLDLPYMERVGKETMLREQIREIIRDELLPAPEHDVEE